MEAIINTGDLLTILGLEQEEKDKYDLDAEPDPDTVIKRGVLEKLCPGARILWQKRQGTLTNDWFGWSTVREIPEA